MSSASNSIESQIQSVAKARGLLHNGRIKLAGVTATQPSKTNVEPPSSVHSRKRKRRRPRGSPRQSREQGAGVSRTIPKRRAVQVLTEAGYRLTSYGKHEVWTNGNHTLTLPNNPQGDLYGFMAQTIRRIEQGQPPTKARRTDGARG